MPSDKAEAQALDAADMGGLSRTLIAHYTGKGVWVGKSKQLSATFRGECSTNSPVVGLYCCGISQNRASYWLPAWHGRGNYSGGP